MENYSDREEINDFQWLEVGEEYAYKGSRKDCLEVMELFCIFTVVVDLYIYTCAKIHNTTHS